MNKREKIELYERIKREVKPEFILKHPDNRVEIILTKVDPSLFTKAEKEYLKYPDIDFITVYYLTGSKNFDESIYGKIIRHRNISEILDKMETAKKRAKNEKEYENIDKQIAYLISLANRAKKLNERMISNSNKFFKKK